MKRTPLEKLGFETPQRRTKAQNTRDAALYRLGFSNAAPRGESRDDDDHQKVLVNQEPEEGGAFDREAIAELKKLVDQLSVRLDGLSRTLDDSVRRGKESISNGRAALDKHRKR